MKGLYKYLSPFAPDQSGAVSVLFELGGLIVICDAGGCAGNVCGFDEPRWFTQKSAVFSAGLRDMDAILGRDDKLIKKIGDAVSQLDLNFIALVGTPVPSVIGTDLKALKHIAEKRFGLPVLTVDTTGMDLYDRGQEKAFLSLFETFASDKSENAPDIGIIGATPLDLLDTQDSPRIASQIEKLGYGKAVCYGMGSGLEDIKKAGGVRCNIVVSPSGIKAAKYLRKRFGTPYVTGIPLTERALKAIKIKIGDALAGKSAAEGSALYGYDESVGDKHVGDNNVGEDNVGVENDGGILIIHQQFVANEIRDELLSLGYRGRIDVASWFMLEDSLSLKSDEALREEDDLSMLLKRRGYKAVAGDPLFKRAISGWDGEYVDLPHYPVSSGIYKDTDINSVLDKLISCV